MAKAKMTPIVDGEQITAAKLNALYDNTTGLTTTVNNITGDQVRTEGLSRRVINTATGDNVKDGANVADGWGHPFVQLNYFKTDTGGARSYPVVAGTEKTRTGMTKTTGAALELDLSSYCVALNTDSAGGATTTAHKGDFIIFEYVAQMSAFHTLDKAFSDSSATYVSGQNYLTDYATVDLNVNVAYSGGGAVNKVGGTDIAGCAARIGSFITCDPDTGATINVGNNNLSFSNDNENGGVGALRSIKLTAVYKVVGTETTLKIQPFITVGNYSTGDGTVARPSASINSDTLTATIFRKGVQRS